MLPIEIKSGIYWIGVNDREIELFEGLWPVKREGVSYNSYLIKGNKSALIDMTTDTKTDKFLDQIAEIIDPAELDYIVVNHMEPDHTGTMQTLRRISPKATILCSKKAVDMISAYYDINEGVRVVKDGETLNLGTHLLKFVMTPFVHWPETMMTYEENNRVLFPCDGFGGYGALQETIFDDQCSNLDLYEQESLRYYVNIVASYSKLVLKAIEKLADVPIDVVAPSHGLIWRKNPQRIIELYKQWANYAKTPEVGVTLLYGTMYGRTEQMVKAIGEGVKRANLPLDIFDVRYTHSSYILPSLYASRGVLIGAPTYEGGLFPPITDLMNLAKIKHIFNRRAAYFGSYGWSGGAQRDFNKLAENLQWNVFDGWEFKGSPTTELLKQGEEFGYHFAESLKESN